jgi:hypothetical protein
MAFVGPTPNRWVWPGRGPVRHRTTDDREARASSTPEESGRHPEETRDARQRLARGLPTLLASVFAALVVVALVVFVVRSLL